MIFKDLRSGIHLGLLIIRVGLGIMFILHGFPKLIGGPQKWEQVGSAMGYLGANFYPQAWGLTAAFVELLGGVGLILGFLYLPITILLSFTMFVAVTKHLMGGDDLMGAAHAIEVGVVFLGLIFVGPGKYSIDNAMQEKKRRY